MEFTTSVTGTEFLPKNSVLKIEGDSLDGVSFAGRDLASFISIGSAFKNCDFQEMKISQAVFGGGQRDSTYSGCIFDGSWISAKAPGFALFEKCSFLNVVFTELNCRNIEFVDCIFSGEIRKGFFNGSTSDEAQAFLGRKNNRFVNNDLSRLKIGDVGFRSGIDLSKQILPIDNAYIVLDAKSVISRAGEIAGELSDPDKKALSVLLKLLERDVATGQEQVFFNTKAFPTSFQAIFDLMR